MLIVGDAGVTTHHHVGCRPFESWSNSVRGSFEFPDPRLDHGVGIASMEMPTPRIGRVPIAKFNSGRGSNDLAWIADIDAVWRHLAFYERHGADERSAADAGTGQDDAHGGDNRVIFEDDADQITAWWRGIVGQHHIGENEDEIPYLRMLADMHIAVQADIVTDCAVTLDVA